MNEITEPEWAYPLPSSQSITLSTSQLPKATIEEPAEWGSVVRAFVCGGHSELWVRTWHGFHSGWTNDRGDCVTWHQLCDPEVLRVGVGETAEPTTRTEWGVKFDAPGNGYPGEERIEVFESEDAAVECVEGRTRAVIVSRQVTEWAEVGA